jgi:KRAB domain-containing zinc finger protein
MNTPPNTNSSILNLPFIESLSLPIQNNKKVICSLCNKLFSNKNNLKTHISSIHNKNLPFFCPYSNCSKKYPNKTKLEAHIRTHKGIKPFQCEKCGKKFNENGNLKSHLNKHDENIKFKCSFCEKSYKSNNHLKEHINIIHLNHK